MFNYEIVFGQVDIQNLDNALRAHFATAISGMSTAGDRVIIWFYDDPGDQEKADADALLAAHDPAILRTERTYLTNMGQESTLDVTVSLPRNLVGASTIVFMIEGQQSSPIALVNNQATITLDPLDLIDGDTIEVGVVGFDHTPLSIEVRDHV